MAAFDWRPRTVSPESELGHLLDEARAEPVFLLKDGIVYRLSAEVDEPDTSYEPGAVRDAIAQFAGSWSDIDAGNLIAEIYRAREEGSRPLTRPE